MQHWQHWCQVLKSKFLGQERQKVIFQDLTPICDPYFAILMESDISRPDPYFDDPYFEFQDLTPILNENN